MRACGGCTSRSRASSYIISLSGRLSYRLVVIAPCVCACVYRGNVYSSSSGFIALGSRISKEFPASRFALSLSTCVFFLYFLAGDFIFPLQLHNALYGHIQARNTLSHARATSLCIQHSLLSSLIDLTKIF